MQVKATGENEEREGKHGCREEVVQNAVQIGKGGILDVGCGDNERVGGGGRLNSTTKTYITRAALLP